MSVIKPTVGRVLLYWPAAHDIAAGMFAYEGSDQPFAATVTFVHGDRMVNLSVADHNGAIHEKRSVTLLQEGDQANGPNGKAGYAEWMPFQKGQAAKTEALESAAKSCTCTGKAGCTRCPAPTADSAIEREIVAKGLTAPRVTLDDVKANIISEHYFSAGHGATFGTTDVAGTPSEGYPPSALNLLTFCVLVLRNGFTVTGESACASPENFDAELGRKIARENAVNKVWPLMGYELKSRLHERELALAEPQCAEDGIEFKVDVLTGPMPPHGQAAGGVTGD